MKTIFYISFLFLHLFSAAQFKIEENYPFEVSQNTFRGQLYIFLHDYVLVNDIFDDIDKEAHFITFLNKGNTNKIKGVTLKRADDFYYFEFNKNNQLKKIIKNNDTAYYEYNSNNELTRLRMTKDTFDFNYNLNHQITSIKNQGTRSIEIEWKHDLIQSVKNVWYGDAQTFNLSYNFKNQLISILCTQSDQKPKVEKYQYDSLGRIFKIAGLFSLDKDTTYLKINYSENRFERCLIGNRKCFSVNVIQTDQFGRVIYQEFNQTNSTNNRKPKEYYFDLVTNEKVRIYKSLYQIIEFEYDSEKLITETIKWKKQKDKKESLLIKKYVYNGSGIITNINFSGDQAQTDWEISYTYF